MSDDLKRLVNAKIGFDGNGNLVFRCSEDEKHYRLSMCPAKNAYMLGGQLASFGKLIMDLVIQHKETQ